MDSKDSVIVDVNQHGCTSHEHGTDGTTFITKKGTGGNFSRTKNSENKEESTAEQDVAQHHAVAMALQMPEILEKIFGYLADPKDLINSALVSRKWRDAAYHPSLWRLETAKLILQPSDTIQLLPSLARRRIPLMEIWGLRTHMRDLLPSLPSLKSLFFGPVRQTRCSFSTITDRTLAGAFQQRHTSLISLHLCNCTRITDNSVTLLSSQLPNLETLCMSSCPLVTDVGLVAVARGLPRLKSLYVAHCAVTDAGVAALAGRRPDVASGTPLLTELSLCECRITDTALLYVSVGLPRMEELMLAKCLQITDAGLGHLANIRELRFLELYGCPGITNDGLLRFPQLAIYRFAIA